MTANVECWEEDDEAAMIAASQVEPRAFSALYQRHVQQVYRYLRARTSSDEDAADLTHEVFLKALDSLPGYRPSGVPFAAWLFRIARNSATDAHRRRRITTQWDLVPEALQPSREAQPEEAALEREAFDLLRSLLLALPTDRREAIVLRFVAGLSVREIAVVMGKREAAVYKQLHRTLQVLKERYDAQ